LIDEATGRRSGLDLAFETRGPDFENG